MKYLIDTDWLVDAYIGRPVAARLLDDLHPQGIAVSIIPHGELYEGAFDYIDTDHRLERIRALLA